MQVAASGFNNLRDLNPPICPHAANPFRTSDYSQLKTRRRNVDGVSQWVFEAVTHSCQFVGVSSTSFLSLALPLTLLLAFIPSVGRTDDILNSEEALATYEGTLKFECNPQPTRADFFVQDITHHRLC